MLSPLGPYRHLVHVVATTPAELADAEALVFEYMAATRVE